MECMSKKFMSFEFKSVLTSKASLEQLSPTHELPTRKLINSPTHKLIDS